jgi:rubrerythrin
MDVAELASLIRILQLAYSGELAAGYAYRGHWHSVRNNAERDRIQQIEEEEWHHRKLVGGILKELNAQADPKRERRANLIGRSLQFLCHVTGWLLPMYMAGRLESRNIREYETAARHAARSGHPEYIDCLLIMAEVEWEHEKYFRDRVLCHWIGSRLQLWPEPPPKEHIRSSFADELV